ncbi:hypothetical protein CAP36_02275 [Chitinophagaceae bacterium IBVUCB2]|nr:hypothetical protein CAP36_02275 [Chitinophagaceae bacterium IBVUCB2]
MKKIISLLLLFLCSTLVLFSQNKVGINTATPDSTLTVAGSTNVTANLKVGNNLSLPTYPITRDNSAATFPSNMLYTDALGNLLSAPSKQRVNHVLVKSATDFPAASGGIITLTSGTLYEVNGTIVLTDKINLNGCYLIGRDANNDKLIYTPGSGELFTGTKGGTIRSLTLVANTTGSKLFNLDMTVTENLIVRDAIIASCKNVGLVKGGYITFFSVINYAGNSNGITYQDNANLLLDNTAWFPTNSGTFEKLTGTFDIIEKLGGFSQPMLATAGVAVDVTGITTINEGATLKNTAFMGTGTRINGTFSKKWEVESPGIATEKDDVSTGNLYLSSIVNTIFSGVDVPTKVLGTTVAASLFRVTSPSNNRLTYDGTKSKRFQVIASLSVTAQAANKYFSFYVVKNGVILPESKQAMRLSSGVDKGSVTLSCTILLNANDYIEIWAENNSDNSYVTLETLNLAIK